ncbi:MAG: hypothetical protein LBN95_02245 [Prevotellaceae bacterium]|jgi:hypothetical protein|nr:hypothetical protein [Prevotellaceae bacterium]
MKKYFLIIFAVSALFSCRNDIITKSTPENVFLAFWKIMDENYVYFEEKGIDWDSVYNIYYPKAQTAKTDRDLFNIFAEIVPMFNDRHVSLSGYLPNNFSNGTFPSYYIYDNSSFEIETLFETDTLFQMPKGDDVIVHIPDTACEICVKEVILMKYLNFSKTPIKLESYQNTIKNYGMIVPRHFENSNLYGSANEQIMTECLNNLNYSNGLIINLIHNEGGTDLWGILSLFYSGERTVAYELFKTGKGHNDFSEKIYQTFTGKGLVSETVPVILLTGPDTFSAANQFAYIMKDLPNCILIGKKTGGGGGAIRELKLPNSWQVHYPFEKGFTMQDENMEYPLMPDIYVKRVNANHDVTNESDVILKAIEVLDSINGF